MLKLKSVLVEALNEAIKQNEIQNLVKTYQPQLAQIGINVGNSIGQGTQGMVFLTDNGQVLKVTQDQTEANAAANLVDKDFKNIYKIFQVFEFGEGGYYGILQEKLQKIGWGDALEKLFYTELGILLNDITSGKKDLDSSMPQIEQIMTQSFPDEQERNKLQVILNQILNGIRELSSVGIKYRDLNISNVMKRGNEYVLIDFGYSKAPQAQIQKI